MTYRTSFILFGTRYEFMLNTENLDRNYDDENYTYWIVKRNGKYFEINIWKDDDGRLTGEGVVYGYSSRGSFEDGLHEDDKSEIIFLAA